MVKIDFSYKFKQTFYKIKDNLLKIRIEKQIRKIVQNPKMGKPMKNFRKNTRELYIKPFRLSYLYDKENNKIILLDFYHKKFQ